MSYTPINWQTGDTITAAKLNHMEDGISGAVPLTPDTLIVTFTFDEENLVYISDTSFSDMVAIEQPKPIVAVVPGVGTIPLMQKSDSQGNIVDFHYSDCDTDGTRPEEGAVTVTFTRFTVVYDSEDDRTIGQFSNINFNFQTSVG